MFFAYALLSMAVGAMADTVTLTATEAADKKGGWTLQVQAPDDIAGWQMLVSLPEELAINSSELKVGDATFTKFDVTLPAAYNGKYAVVGTKTEGGGYFMFCFPVAEKYATADVAKVSGSKQGNICTINLKAKKPIEGDPLCTITNIVTSDEKGATAHGEVASLAVRHPLGDANYDYLVNGQDIQTTINLSAEGEYSKGADTNGDNVVNGQDIQTIIGISAK